MALSLLSHFTRHRHQVLFRPCIHSLRQAPQVRFTRSKTRCFAACPITYFRGHWRLQSKQFREFKLSHFRDLVFFSSELILPRRDPSLSSLWCQDARGIEHGLMFCLSHHLSLSSGSFQARYSFFQVGSLGQICQVQIGDPWYAPYRGHCVCVHRYSKRFNFCPSCMCNLDETGGPSMCCVRWSNEAATVHADITADHRDVPAFD